VLTSRHEGLPISLLEAMALGLAPVVSAVGGVPEVVTDGRDGILLEPGDPIAFATALQDLASDPARRNELGRAAAARASDFDIRRTQAELERRYRSLLADR
jgi:glycosyltransferase involved in cell wall biosynthesis